MKKKEFDKLLQEFIEARNKLAEVRKVEAHLKKQVMAEMNIGDSVECNQFLVEMVSSTSSVKNVEAFLAKGLDPDDFYIKKVIEKLKVNKVRLA